MIIYREKYYSSELKFTKPYIKFRGGQDTAPKNEVVNEREDYEEESPYELPEEYYEENTEENTEELPEEEDQ